MDDETKNMLTTFATALLVVALVGGIALAGLAQFNKATCSAQTADVGFPSRWSVFGGCQIEVESGRWIPLDNYYYKQE